MVRSYRVDIATCQLETATLDMPVVKAGSPNHSTACHAIARAISLTGGVAGGRVKAK